MISIGPLVLQVAQIPLASAPQTAEVADAAKNMLPLNAVIGDWIQFVGYFFAIGALGFRFGVAGRLRQTVADARSLLRMDAAASLGALGAALLLLSLVGGTYVQSLLNHTTIFEAIAAICVLLTVLQPVINLRPGGIANAIHILAASAWLGTLLVLTIVGIRGVMKRNPASAPRARLIADLVNAFSPVALASASVLVISGGVTAWLHLKRVSALLDTPYGNALIVKLVLVAIVAALGAWNWKQLKPRLGDEGADEKLKRSAVTELTVATLVLVATAILVTLPSPK